jgi:peroxiredoxin
MNKMLKVILPVMLISALLISMLLIAGCSGESEIDMSELSWVTRYSVDPDQSPELGETAPDFEFENDEGHTASLSDFRGEVVLVNFWATWCGPCTIEMPFIQQVYDERSGKGVVVMLINLGDSASTVTSFLDQHDLSLPVLLNPNQELVGSYNIEYIPTTFFLDEDGVIQHIEVGAFSSKEDIESILSQLGITE